MNYITTLLLCALSCISDYVKELMGLLFQEVFPDPVPFVAKMKEVHVPPFLSSQYQHPDKAAAVAAHLSRFVRPEPAD